MIILGQVGLYRMPTPSEMNYFVTLISQARGYQAIRGKKICGLLAGLGRASPRVASHISWFIQTTVEGVSVSRYFCTFIVCTELIPHFLIDLFIPKKCDLY